MEQNFELAVKIVMNMINEDRPPSQEEKALLAQMVGVALFDLHSIAKNLERLANAAEKTNG